LLVVLLALAVTDCDLSILAWWIRTLFSFSTGTTHHERGPLRFQPQQAYSSYTIIARLKSSWLSGLPYHRIIALSS